MTEELNIKAIHVPDGSVIVDGTAFDVLTGIADLYRQLLEEVDDLRAREAAAERLIHHIRNEKRPTIDRIIGWQNDADRWLTRSHPASEIWLPVNEGASDTARRFQEGE